MENASKALIMAAEILVGIMIISIGVYIFNMFAEFSQQRYQEIEDRQIAEFNERFYKYYGTTTNDFGKVVPIECTIHDIVSLANFAQKHNLENDLIESQVSGTNIYKIKSGVSTTNSLYVQIELKGKTANLELKSDSYLIDLIKQNDLQKDDSGKKTKTKYYKCTACEPRGSNERVNYIKFEEI